MVLGEILSRYDYKPGGKSNSLVGVIVAVHDEVGDAIASGLSENNEIALAPRLIEITDVVHYSVPLRCTLQS